MLTSIILDSIAYAEGCKINTLSKREVYLRELGDSTRLVNQPKQKGIFLALVSKREYCLTKEARNKGSLRNRVRNIFIAVDCGFWNLEFLWILFYIAGGGIAITTKTIGGAVNEFHEFLGILKTNFITRKRGIPKQKPT